MAPALKATFTEPTGVALGPKGELYILDAPNPVRWLRKAYTGWQDCYHRKELNRSGYRMPMPSLNNLSYDSAR